MRRHRRPMLGLFTESRRRVFNGDDTVLHPGDNTSGHGAFFDGDAAPLSPVNASSTPLSISCWGMEEIAMAFLALRENWWIVP